MAEEITSPLVEEYPVTDIDFFLPAGDVKEFTLLDGTDTYELTADGILLKFGNGEVLVMFYRHVAGYSIRRRVHTRKIVKPVTVSADPQAALPPAETSLTGPSDAPSNES